MTGHFTELDPVPDLDIGQSTARLQAAIDDVHVRGGGTVQLAAGVHSSGTLRLRSHVRLHLSHGAELRASPLIADYARDTHWQRYADEANLDRCFIYAEDAEDIAIDGSGVIDGQGAAFPNPGCDQRPMLIRMLRCRGVRISGVVLRDPAAWTTAFLACREIRASGLRISSRANRNGDGLDFDACEDVVVSDCRIDGSDDCICLQNSFPSLACRNIVVSNCVLSGRWAGMRIGLLSSGPIEDVVVTGCVMRDLGCSGIKIQATEGGSIRNMLFADLVMRNVPRPLFATLNRRRIGRDPPSGLPAMGRISGLTLRGLRLRNDDLPASPSAACEGLVLCGSPGARIDDVAIRDVDAVFAGGGSPPDAPPPGLGTQRPEYTVFGPRLPAAAVWLRHVAAISMHRCRWRVLRTDARPAMVAEDAMDCLGIVATAPEIAS